MVIIEDKGQQEKKHERKHIFSEKNGIYWKRYPLPVGDYILGCDTVMDVIGRKQKRGMEPKKMDFLGAYTICVDTKKDMQEICGNICGVQHARFRDECILAKNNGIRLIVLVENNEGINTLSDVEKWQNKRLKMQKWVTTPSGQKRRILKYPDATPGPTLYKAMSTMTEKYGVEFEFCSPEQSGRRIMEILTESKNED